ncbi:MAG TPA: UDP-glucose/GDP-mannose dehydrogenase family protein [Bacteroidales bacterium]|nr:UDP-glucose/GDP-mannose dehydrogenase family protein [Bacteroidales bacterium]HRW85938.1 UDP-glucose/GDP-mannose dehydrogenase family protein [Bacteroidales bacterium]
MKISVVGTGYVGLVTGTCFAESGLTVTCIDRDKDKIARLGEGEVPIYEPGLETMMRLNIEKKRLFFTTSIEEGIKDSEVIFIAVGTPPGEDGSADLTHVLDVAGEIGSFMETYAVVVTKSTVPVGTSEKIRQKIAGQLKRRNSNLDFDIASNPEFLKEGAAVEDFLRPERIVIGVDNERTATIMRRLYNPFVLNNHPILFMDIASAEITKYAANAMLATRISFINEIANLCDILGADISHVRKGIGSDSRIGSKFLYPGTGYGGSCFPKDVKALIKTAHDKGYELKVIRAVEKANEFQKNVIFNKMAKYFNNNLGKRVIGVWGLSFKPKTDDIRESSSLYLISKLLNEGAVVRAYDPAAMKEAEKVLGKKIFYAYDPYEAVRGADAMVLMTEWSEFHLPDFRNMGKIMKEKVIFDGRNIYNPEEIRNMGFTYFGIGRR